MNTKLGQSHSSSRRRSEGVPTPIRRAALVPKVRATTSTAAPSIRDRVRDQHGNIWIRYGTPAQALWVPVPDFARQDVFARLAHIDPRLIEPAAQSALRSEVARSGSYRSALVAAAPGWIEDHFVLGDGMILAPRANEREVVVTCVPHSKFTAHGSLADWQAVIGPLVTQQPFLLFSLSLAFVGPLLPFVPPDYLSPLFELAGKPGSGKSLCGIVAMSAWAGDPDSTAAGGETWNLSPGRFDTVKLAHRHGLLLLDEANLAGGTLEARRQLINRAVFGLADSGMRQRFGDPPAGLHAQLAVISTSNRPLCDLIAGSSAEREALHQRMITIPISNARANGVLDTVPVGFEGAAEAAEALRAAVNEQWGTAGPAFVRAIQRRIVRDESRFRHLLADGLACRRERLREVSDRPRVQKCFAIVGVAGRLAQQCGIMPGEWGSVDASIRTVAREAFRERALDADPRRSIKAYYERHLANLVEVATMPRPLPRREFEAAPGFLRQCHDGNELLVSAQRFQTAFPKHEEMMRALRASGHARTEGGHKPKLTIKTPRAICEEGRVYCIRLFA